MPALVQHSKATVEHGTPPDVVEVARRVLGEIDYDPCSSAYWQQIVRAKAWGDNMQDDEWPAKARVLMNHPGGEAVTAWKLCTHHWLYGGAVFWVGFNLGQMPYLQPHGFMFRGFRRAMPRKRVAYLQKVEGGPPVQSNAPPHHSYFVLMPSEPEQVERFDAEMRALSAEVW